MGQFVMVAYTPKPEREPQLVAAARAQLQLLTRLQVLGDRPPALMRAADGTLVAVLEWRSAKALLRAQSNDEIRQLSATIAESCQRRPLASLAECQKLFAEFDSIEL